MRRRRQRLPQAPIEADILRLNHEGRGVAEIDGKITFVRGALPGEKVTFRLTRKHGQFDEGEVEEVLTPAPNRIAPQCAVYGLCGGCSLQHMSSADQMQHKAQVLQALLAKEQVEPGEHLPALTAEPWGYRHKARLAVRHVAKKGGVLVGFRETNGRFLTDMHQCEILHASIGLKIDDFRQWLDQLSIKDQIPQIEVAVGDAQTALIIRHLQPFTAEDLDIMTAFAEAHQFWIYLQPKGLDSVELLYPQQAETLLHYDLPHYDLSLYFHPTDFTQVNPAINRKMLDQAMQLLAPQPDERVLDLFCGLGNFTLPLARHAGEVIGVEGDERMVQRARDNAQRNGLRSTEFYAANLFEPIKQQPWWGYEYDKLLLDPPRAGAQEIIEQLADKRFQKIVYVSCNPATLARDAALLCQQGYQVDATGVMDMFPHTAHVESMMVFSPI